MKNLAFFCREFDRYIYAIVFILVAAQLSVNIKFFVVMARLVATVFTFTRVSDKSNVFLQKFKLEILPRFFILGFKDDSYTSSFYKNDLYCRCRCS